MDKNCDVDGCDRQARRQSAAWCETHYYRMRRTGRLDRDAPRMICSVDGCGQRHAALGYCQKHYLRVRAHGDPDFEYRGPNNRNWTGDQASYSAVHQRLRRERGSASQHPCVDCGHQARQWSYDRRGGVVDTVVPHEADLSAYQPRCVPCHKAFDLACLGKAAS